MYTLNWSLVFFWNALFYNEPDSQIAMDADSLEVSSTASVLGYCLSLFALHQNLLEPERTKGSMLPRLRTLHRLLQLRKSMV
jgi:hypothetical protein